MTKKNLKRGKGFTLIELIAVLVIMAIIALIVTPLVMNIIRKARTSADKRSIDAYGRSIELAIAGYLMDTGSFPTSIDQLTIEYSGDEVVCSTTQINTDSSVYLAECTVGGRSVENYIYGKEETTPTPTYTAYQVGDHVSYNNVTYYVIENSDTTNNTVKLLKENPLTKTEMDNLNLTGITISESNGYGQVQYGSSVDYSTSTVKQVVDAWKNTAVKSGDTATARLITWNDLFDNLGYERWNENTSRLVPGTTAQTWVYNGNYYYWTMSQANDSSNVWDVYRNGDLDSDDPSFSTVVRPVLELSKSADITKVS
jgi:prepilin-type N-terminal cleavage/methylation domain-containing protein